MNLIKLYTDGTENKIIGNYSKEKSVRRIATKKNIFFSLLLVDYYMWIRKISVELKDIFIYRGYLFLCIPIVTKIYKEMVMDCNKDLSINFSNCEKGSPHFVIL